MIKPFDQRLKARWVVVPQEQTRKGVTRLVALKTIKRYPKKNDDGTTSFPKLKNPIAQVLINIAESTTPPLKIRRCNGNYSVVWPDVERDKTIKSKGREYIDRLEPGTKVVKGDVEKFPNLKTLVTFIAERFGVELSRRIQELFEDN